MVVAALVTRRTVRRDFAALAVCHIGELEQAERDLRRRAVRRAADVQIGPMPYVRRRPDARRGLPPARARPLEVHVPQVPTDEAIDTMLEASPLAVAVDGRGARALPPRGHPRARRRHRVAPRRGFQPVARRSRPFRLDRRERQVDSSDFDAIAPYASDRRWIGDPGHRRLCAGSGRRGVPANYGASCRSEAYDPTNLSA